MNQFGIVKLLGAFPYSSVGIAHVRCSRIHKDLNRGDGMLETSQVSRSFVAGMEEHLAHLAGWSGADNKTAFLFLSEDRSMNLVSFYDDRFTHLRWFAGKPGAVDDCWGSKIPANVYDYRGLVLTEILNYLGLDHTAMIYPRKE